MTAKSVSPTRHRRIVAAVLFVGVIVFGLLIALDRRTPDPAPGGPPPVAERVDTAPGIDPHDPAAAEDLPHEPVGPPLDQLGQRIEVRPGVFATPTAKIRNLPAGETGAFADYVEITITYENRTAEPLNAMGGFAALSGGVATLDGVSFASSFEGESEPMLNVFPGRTGTVVMTLQPGGAYDRGQPIQIGVGVPALRSEGPAMQTQPGSVPVLVVGVPTT